MKIIISEITVEKTAIQRASFFPESKPTAIKTGIAAKPTETIMDSHEGK